MYDDKQFFVDNPIDRYAIGDHDRLDYGADDSLEPGSSKSIRATTAAANWLPAPTGSFHVVFRAYWPGQPILDGTDAAPDPSVLGTSAVWRGL